MRALLVLAVLVLFSGLVAVYYTGTARSASAKKPRAVERPLPVLAAQSGPDAEAVLARFHEAYADYFGQVDGRSDSRMGPVRYHMAKKLGSERAEKVQLVALLREEPFVYDTNEINLLASRKPLEELKRRALSDFEARAVAALKAGQNLVVERDVPAHAEGAGAGHGGTYRVVGALRSNAACMECHDGAKDRLLGAMTYEISADAVASALARGKRRVAAR